MKKSLTEYNEKKDFGLQNSNPPYPADFHFEHLISISKEKKMNTSSLKKGVYPFQVICCVPEKGFAPYPSYTDGLARCFGMPEFIINYQAFGAQGNAVILHCAYDYFIDPKNSGELDAILNGKIVKLSGKQLNTNLKND